MSPKLQLYPVAKKTLLYFTVTFLAIVIAMPIYFLIVISLHSDHEVYQNWPIPWTTKTHHRLVFENKNGKITMWIQRSAPSDKFLLNQSPNVEEHVSYIETRLNARLSEVDKETIAGLSTGKSTEITVKKNLFANFKTFFSITQDATPALMRSIRVSLLTILISIFIGSLAGYAFARYRFKGMQLMKQGVLFVRIFPSVSIAIPMVMILARIGLYDNPLGLSLVYAVGHIALTVWITAGIFSAIPRSLEDAAMVFGATPLQSFWHVTLPLAAPGLAACSMYAFIGAWNETLQALVLTQFNPTFSVVVYQSLIGAKGMLHLTAAGSLVMALPAVIFTLMIRKYLLQLWGSVKV